MSDQVKTAELKKNAYDRILSEKERQRVDNKIGQILTFSIFKHLTKRRLKNFFRLFFDAKTQEPYVAYRNSYLYRQGDEVDGIYCLISGDVKRIKETWEHSPVRQTHEAIKDEERDDTPLKEDVIRDLKRKKAKQIVLTLVGSGETLGLVEIVAKEAVRQYSI